MRIIQVTTELRPAGAERIVTSLSIELKKLNIDVCVVSLQKKPHNTQIIKELESANIKIHYLNLTKWNLIGIFKFLHIIKTFKPDILHAHLFHASILSRLAKLFNRNLIVINTVHIMEVRKNKQWYFIIDKLTKKLCDHITAVSKSAARFYSHKIGMPEDSIKVIYNGIKIPKELTNSDTEYLHNEWRVTQCSRVIGSIGRLNYQKGYDIFLSILPSLSKFIPDKDVWAVVIIGDGEEKEKLKKIAALCPTNIKVVLKSYRPDAADCIGAFDLFVMPSRFEGFGLTLAEAMAHGIPILSSNIETSVEILNDYQNKKIITFTLENANGIGKTIAEMTCYPHTTPYKKFTMRNMVTEYKNFYLSIKTRA